MDKKKLDSLIGLVYSENVPVTKHSKILLYGDPGAGKTVLGAQVGEKILDVVADPVGWESLDNHPELGLRTGRIRLMKYTGVSQLEALADAVTEGVEPFDQYDTIMLDTASNIAQLDLTLVQKQKIVAMEKKNKDFDYQEDMWPVYNQNALRVKDAMLKLFLAPVNIVAIAHAREVDIKDSGEKRISPMFSPAIFSAISGHCTLIAYMTAESVLDREGNVKYKRQIQYHPTRRVVAKTRIGGLPTTENNPNLRAIIDEWQNRGGTLLTQEEAAVEAPLSEGLHIPKGPAAELEEFTI